MSLRDQAIADMTYARDSHLKWAEHLEAHVASGVPCAQCEGKPYKLNAAHEREWVAKYDNVLALLAQPETPQPKKMAEHWENGRLIMQHTPGVPCTYAGCTDKAAPAAVAVPLPHWLESLIAARDVLSAFGKQAGYLSEQGGYSTRVTDAEMKVAQAVAALTSLIDQVAVAVPSSANKELAEARKALRCLLLEVSESVWRDVNRKVEAAFTALQAAATPAAPGEPERKKPLEELADGAVSLFALRQLAANCKNCRIENGCWLPCKKHQPRPAMQKGPR